MNSVTEDTAITLSQIERELERRLRSQHLGEAFVGISMREQLIARGIDSPLLRQEDPPTLRRRLAPARPNVNTNDVVRTAQGMSDDEGRMPLCRLRRQYRSLNDQHFDELLQAALDDGRLVLINDRTTLIVRRGA